MKAKSLNQLLNTDKKKEIAKNTVSMLRKDNRFWGRKMSSWKCVQFFSMLDFKFIIISVIELRSVTEAEVNVITMVMHFFFFYSLSKPSVDGCAGMFTTLQMLEIKKNRADCYFQVHCPGATDKRNECDKYEYRGHIHRNLLQQQHCCILDSISVL